MLNVNITRMLYLFVIFAGIHAFTPIPIAQTVGQTGEGLTHTEITELGFIRSLAHFFSETGTNIGEEYFNTNFTIDDLYKLKYPEWTIERIQLQSSTLKGNLAVITLANAFVDADPWEKELTAAHFDNEAFIDGNNRILKLRKTAIDAVRSNSTILIIAHASIGQLLHTLQDFYTHSNWVELGHKDINDRIGIYEDIGPVASPNQPTCTSVGCTMITVNCSWYQKKVTMKKRCPLVYYDCKNNIRQEIIEQGLLTSGYLDGQHNENNEPVSKPRNVKKCSHGSVRDPSSHYPSVGGINKDNTIPLYSPHYYLHYEAANLAVAATERFFNDLRKDLGDAHFDRLFAIHPTDDQLEAASERSGADSYESRGHLKAIHPLLSIVFPFSLFSGSRIVFWLV